MRIKDWIDSNNDFDRGKFESTAARWQEMPTDPDPLTSDVRCFAECSIHLVTGSSTVTNVPFQASLYRDRGWSDEFLEQIQSLMQSDEVPTLSMRTLRGALAAHAHISPTPAPPSGASQPAQPLTEIPVSPVIGETTPTNSLMPRPMISIALRNGTVGRPYSIEPGEMVQKIASSRGDNPTFARIPNLHLPENCGLVFDPITGAVTGTPTYPLEGEFTLDYLPSEKASSVSFRVTLLINPDPASLWKDLPPTSDAPYQKDVLAHSEEYLGAFRIVAASRRGRSHAQKAEFRDDDYAVGFASETGWLVVVVADGAGSATYSRRGSQIACDVAKNRLLTVLNSAHHNQAEALYLQHRDWQHPEVKKALRQCLYEAALLAHHKLRAEVAQPTETLPTPATLRNYDTTLILLVLKKTGEGCIAATFAIGDGGAGILPHAGEGVPLTKADSGEHAGQTIFLTFDSTVANTETNLESRFHLEQTQEFAGALAMTDGITDPKFPSDAAFADPTQWAALWADLQPALTSSQALLDWMNFFSPGNHDDRTLVAVLPAPPAAPDTP